MTICCPGWAPMTRPLIMLNFSGSPAPAVGTVVNSMVGPAEPFPLCGAPQPPNRIHTITSSAVPRVRVENSGRRTPKIHPYGRSVDILFDRQLETPEWIVLSIRNSTSHRIDQPEVRGGR